MRAVGTALVLVAASVRAAAALPDLVVHRPTLEAAITVELRSFAPDACELQPADLCVGAPGARKVLRFGVLAVNQGDEDLVVGLPNDDERLGNGEPKWVYSACHGHYHFQTFARYELRRRGESAPVLTGQKRAFCMQDTQRLAGATTPHYCCDPHPTRCPMPLQGIQAGWGDLYASNLPCQWIDITDAGVPGTDLPPGDYDVCVALNTAGVLPESDAANNVECVPVTLGAPLAPAPKVKLRRLRPRGDARVGRRVKVSWKRRSRGELQYQEVWLTTDGGASWRLIASSARRRNAYPWPVPAEAVSDAARLRVVVWTRRRGATGAGAYQRGMAESATFRVLP